MKQKYYLLVLFASLFITYCSSSQQTTTDSNENKDQTEVYIFDDAEIDTTGTEVKENQPAIKTVAQDTMKTEEPETFEMYLVQIGAFTTEERAKKFIDENKSKLE